MLDTVTCIDCDNKCYANKVKVTVKLNQEDPSVC